MWNQNTIDARLLAANNAIVNVEAVQEVKNLMAEIGYDDTKLVEGKVLYDNANRLNIEQKRE
ncbi:MAG: hypothetical protein AAF600_19230 [Bacteroidota bacterium]